MKRIAVIAVCLICTSVMLSPLYADNIEDFISKYTGENGEGYMQPLANSFTANLNSGLFQSARIPKEGLHFKIDLVTMLAITPDDDKVFNATTQEPFSPDTTVSAPTIFGSTNPVSVGGTGGTVFTFPGGLAIEKLPFLVPQVTFGNIRGTEFKLRYFQVTLDDNIENIKLFGFGFRHNINQYFKDLPLDLAASFFYQTFKVGDIIEAKTTCFGVQGSYTEGILSLYGGPTIETSSFDVSYEFDDGSQVDIDMNSDNTFRFTVGAAIDIRILRLFIDYNLASQSALALGIGFGSM